ncbi:porin family protein, partial [Vibrio vulnificus]|nr:porin family protein [Vibrio vulnificus]
MKKTLLVAALTSASFSVLSSPYIGLEYGLGTTNHDGQSRFASSPEVKLDPSNDDGILGGFIGYSLSP